MGIDGPVADGPPPPCVLKITGINGRDIASVSEIVGDDDQDLSQPGIQIDVEVKGTNLADTVDVGLSVTSQALDAQVKPVGGTATFKAVTVASDLTVVVLQAYAAGCKSSSVQLNVAPPPECVFVDPTDGSILGKTQDKDPNDNQYTYDVKLSTQNAQTGDVTLFIDSTQAGGKVQPDISNNVVFSDTVLPEKTMVLRADVAVGSVVRSCTATITVKSGLPLCKITGFTPAPITVSPPVGPAQGLGVNQDAKPATAGLETNIEVETDPAVDQVTLFIDGSPHGAAINPATPGKAVFTEVPLADGNHSITATCAEKSSGNSAQSGPAQVLVDSKPPANVTNFTCSVTDNRAGDLTCNWTAVGDQGPSGMELYQVRYSVGTKLTDTNWATATTVPGVTAFSVGLPQQVQLKGLPLAQTYYFGIRALDFVKNESGLDDDDQGQGRLVDFEQQERPAVSGAGGWGGAVAAGDFNCDGYADIAVGSPDDSSGMGRVYIYLGNANGVLQNPEKIISGTVAGGKLGARVVSLGNFDGDTDGCADLAVWASHGETKAARVFVYLGRKLFFDREDITQGLGAELVYELASAAPSTQLLGKGIAGAGDFDNDGAADLLVTHTDTGSDSSTVLVVHGDKTLQLMGSGKSPVAKTLPGAAGVQVTGGKASEKFGYGLSCGALLDGDSYTDLLFGASGTAGGGAAYVVRGGIRAGTLPELIPLSSARVTKIAGGSGNAAFGSTVAFVGNMDGAGLPEFAVADPTVGSNTGQVYLFNLDGTAPTGVANAVAVVTHNIAGAAGDKFGIAMGCGAGADPKAGADLDGDGYADLLVAVESLGTTGGGAVFEIPGAASLTGLSSSTASYTFSPPGGPAPSFGATVVLAGDVNKDGYIDVVVGDPGHDSGKGRLLLFY